MKNAEEILKVIFENAGEHDTPKYIALKAMHEYASQSRWVKVSERLPEVGERVIIYHCEIGMQIGWLGNNNKWNGYYGQVDKDHVTHWMELPTPPKD